MEGTPPVETPAEVAAYAEAIAGLLDRHDPGSTWVLQAWPFGYRADYWSPDRIAAFLGAMPAGRTLVLDLWAEHASVRERAGGFAGRPWCWSVLHSLGGRPGLHGAVDVIAAEPARLRTTPEGSGLVGVGSTMESLGHDPLVWALLADVRWSGDGRRPRRLGRGVGRPQVRPQLARAARVVEGHRRALLPRRRRLGPADLGGHEPALAGR